MEQLKAIKELINQGEIERAVEELDKWLLICTGNKDEVYYLKGNAYRKQGNWQQALNCYQSAIELNPESPALYARDAVRDILNFRNKDMYNQ
ncbi:MAG: tetratricopeptide repeat protein [Mediterranea sp.]|nr:tetratricopeptide repeat protein [Mediterranea sp.]